MSFAVGGCACRDGRGGTLHDKSRCSESDRHTPAPPHHRFHTLHNVVSCRSICLVKLCLTKCSPTALERNAAAIACQTVKLRAGAGSDVDSVLALGRSKVQLEEIAPWGRAEAELRFVACEPGLLTLNMVLTDDREQSTLDRLAFGVYAR